MFVLEHVGPLHFLGKQNIPKCMSFLFVGLILMELGFQSVSVITSWHRYIRLLGSLTLHSETAVEVFIASQAPQTSSEEGK